MMRLAVLVFVVSLCVVPSPAALAQPDLSGPPVYYEVLINGESFRVQGNRMVKVESQQKPGTAYQIAVRIAPTQPLRLNTLQFEYDLPAKITDDHGQPQRTVRLKHELGFSMLMTDLGGPVKPSDIDGALAILTNSVTKSYETEAKTDEDRQRTELEVGKPHDRTFGEVTARGSRIHYRDPQGFGQTSLAYVLSGPQFTATCLIQYRDNDGEEVLPLIKKILESVRAVR